MARYAPLWLQVPTYPAQIDRQLMAALFPNGGAAGNPATAVNNTLQVSVPAGLAAVLLSGTNGAALCRWDAPETITLGAGPGAGTSRIDSIFAQVRDPQLDGGQNSDFIVTAFQGSAAASPTPPVSPANAYRLFNVLVPSGVANLNTATITDVRVPLTPPAAYARVGRAGAWTTAGAPTPVVFDTVLESTGGSNYNTANGRYTCPASGRYLITAVVSALATAATQYGRADAMKNGAVVMNGPYVIVPAALGIYSPLTAVVRAVPGDYLQVGYETNPAGLAGTGGTNIVWATFDYLGP